MNTNWIYNYKLFLFDFDGLLVNTEKLHFLAYQNMCAARNVHLKWTFADFYQIAHYSSTGLSEYLYTNYPELKAQESSWDVLYQEKRKEILKLCEAGLVELMPGVATILAMLEKANIQRCVVTHSSKTLISLIRDKIPILQSIPHWITREDYIIPKPNPECYIKAVNEFANPEDAVIGFEDTPRGLSALMHTKALPILISTMDYPEIPKFLAHGAKHFATFEHFLSSQ